MLFSRKGAKANLRPPLFSTTYVPTLLFWTESSHFEKTALVPLFLPEICRFEMTLPSNIYAFFKPITLFADSMWKYLLLLTKLGVCIAHGHRFIMINRSVSKKSLCRSDTSKRSAKNKFENQYFVFFKTWKVLWN